MQHDIASVLIDRDRIAQRVEAIAEEIRIDHERMAGPGVEPEITLVPILTGSIIFVADLVRMLPLRMQIRLISFSSYPGKSTSAQAGTFQQALSTLPESLEGAHVLLIDDILDSGQTLRVVGDAIRERRPASLKSCVLLRKLRSDAMAAPVDYVCFDIPDEFVVGYGLDYDDHYRNLPDIVTLKPEVVASREAES